MASKNSDNELFIFLKNHNFGKYFANFKNQGAHDVIDILDGVDKDVLTNDIGMSLLEANRFMKMVENYKKPTIEEDIEELSRLQSKRLKMDINYQLFTTLQPPLNVISSINTTELRYYDLVNMICIRERDILGEELTVELYSCEGYPLATYPGAYIRKLSDWCLEEYNDNRLLYAIPRPKIYTDCQIMHTTNKLPKGKDKVHVLTIDYTIKTNCCKGTYYELCNSIQEITGIPAHLIQIKANNELIFKPTTDHSLSTLNVPIIKGSVIEFFTPQEFWESLWCNNFSFVQYHPCWHNQQSKYGISQFFSCLYSLSDWMYENNNDRLCLETLGHIRSITGCPPLIHSLYLLFSKINITLPHIAAITEVLMHLFQNIKPKQYKEKGFIGAVVQDSEVAEYTNLFWAFLISRAEVYHGNTENFETISLIDNASGKKLENPLAVTNSPGKHIIDKKYYKGEKENAEITLWFKRLTTSFLTDEAVVWKRVQMHPCGVDLTPEWKQLTIEFKNYPPLCIQAPLLVKSSECTPPAMLPINNVEIGVYISDAKDGSRNYIYFDVLTGKENLFDVDILDKVLKSNPPKCMDILKQCNRKPRDDMGRLTRDPEEVTLVLLDTSGSMKHEYENGKTRCEAVIEAFIAFSDRTNAYDLKHAIGLVLFTENSTLEYPISENIKEFSDKFTSFPSGQMTAIYKAINFAIQEFHGFDLSYPQYSHVQKRILCLTDGDDNSSKLTAEQATNMLLKHRIIMDTVILSNELTYTHYIAKASGGYSFRPKSCAELLAIFENEPMLTLSMRKQVKSLLSPCDDSDPVLLQSKGKVNKADIQFSHTMSMMQLLTGLNTEQLCDGWLTNDISSSFDETTEHVTPEKLEKPSITMHKCLTYAMRQKHLGKIVYTVTHTKRLLQELAYYATEPHESFQIFPCEESIDFWQLILTGPSHTCYEGGIFHLFIEFTDKYPSKPPNIRFITPIYHCNINQAGKVCHSILDRYYTPGIRLKEILNYVYGLLLDPAPDDPLDTVKATELKFNPNMYTANARAYTAKHAKQYKTTIDLKMKILMKAESYDGDMYQSDYVCPLTGELFVDPCNNNEGETYEREAIESHIKSGCEYDPFSFLPLKEEDLRPNKSIKKIVDQYRKDITDEAKMK
ncbi:hypothetical protein LOD99_14351 [Oopsacas minuta]|uniref:E2 ubiquitin-conjugating enzyme n=1 Tax=Oopsacas minuta TaxID=111878 RepID=A0AAV7KH55_9METZ|nr:hypothetical protein LOD99_14351 [Oopsacas minuta]